MLRLDRSRWPVPEADQDQADCCTPQPKSNAEPLQRAESAPLASAEQVDGYETRDTDQAHDEDEDA